MWQLLFRHMSRLIIAKPTIPRNCFVPLKLYKPQMPQMLQSALDSSYVHLGATGAARRWDVRSWVGSAGTRVSNVTLWEELLVEPDKPGRPIVWVKIPSHVGIQGNTQAELPANAGRLASPLYPSRQHGPNIVSHKGNSPHRGEKSSMCFHHNSRNSFQRVTLHCLCGQ